MRIGQSKSESALLARLYFNTTCKGGELEGKVKLKQCETLSEAGSPAKVIGKCVPRVNQMWMEVVIKAKGSNPCF